MMRNNFICAALVVFSCSAMNPEKELHKSQFFTKPLSRDLDYLYNLADKSAAFENENHRDMLIDFAKCKSNYYGYQRKSSISLMTMVVLGVGSLIAQDPYVYYCSLATGAYGIWSAIGVLYHARLLKYPLIGLESPVGRNLSNLTWKQSDRLLEVLRATRATKPTSNTLSEKTANKPFYTVMSSVPLQVPILGPVLVSENGAFLEGSFKANDVSDLAALQFAHELRNHKKALSMTVRGKHRKNFKGITIIADGVSAANTLRTVGMLKPDLQKDIAALVMLTPYSRKSLTEFCEIRKNMPIFMSHDAHKELAVSKQLEKILVASGHAVTSYNYTESSKDKLKEKVKEFYKANSIDLLD